MHHTKLLFTISIATFLAIMANPRAVSEGTRPPLPPRFVKITDSPAVSEKHVSYACAWGDYDRDGLIDLLVVHGWGDLPSLFRNTGNGGLAKADAGALATSFADSSSAVWGDYDNDGYLDLFVAGYELPSEDFLFRGRVDGAFTRITAGGVRSDSLHGNSALWMDYNRDGHLDLLMANGSGERETQYENLGDGNFRAVTTGAFVTARGDTKSLVAGDLDNDGASDLLAINADNTGIRRYRFEVGAGLVSVAETSPVLEGLRSTWGGVLADFDNDGYFDLAVSGTRGTKVFSNLRDGTFRPLDSSPATLPSGSFSMPAAGDLNNDGWIDLVYLAYNKGTNRVFLNAHGVLVPTTEGPLATEGGRSWGCAMGDYDNDGQLDIFVANGDSVLEGNGASNSYLYRNSGSTNAWLILNLVGGPSNRSAIGARVRVEARIDGRSVSQIREVSGGNGFGGQHDARLHFGLGDAVRIDRLVVHWPSGTVQELRNVEPGKIHTLIEPPKVATDAAGKIRILGVRGMDYTVESSADLSRWSRIGVGKGGAVFTDSEAPTRSARFYRTTP